MNLKISEQNTILNNIDNLLKGSIGSLSESVALLMSNEDNLKKISKMKCVNNCNKDCSEISQVISQLIGIILLQKEENQKSITSLKKEKDKAIKINKELIEKNESLQKDNLTGLYNRYGFEKDFEIMKSSGKSLSFSVLDIDDFKRVNDTYGHLAGDKVLQYLANFLLKGLEDIGGKVYRFGGEEFMILYYGTKEELNIILNNLLNELHKIVLSSKLNDKVKIKFTFSGGVCEYEKDDDFEKLFSKADDLLYLVKKSGKNNVICRMNKKIEIL